MDQSAHCEKVSSDKGMLQLLIQRLQSKEIIIQKLNQQIVSLTQKGQQQSSQNNFEKVSLRLIDSQQKYFDLEDQLDNCKFQLENQGNVIENLQSELMIVQTYKQQYELVQFEFEREVVKSTQLQFDNEKLQQQLDFIQQECELLRKNQKIEVQQIEQQNKQLQNMLYQEVEQAQQKQKNFDVKLSNIIETTRDDKLNLTKEQLIQENIFLQKRITDHDIIVEELNRKIDYFTENFQIMGQTVKNASTLISENEMLRDELQALQDNQSKKQDLNYSDLKVYEYSCNEESLLIDEQVHVIVMENANSVKQYDINIPKIIKSKLTNLLFLSGRILEYLQFTPQEFKQGIDFKTLQYLSNIKQNLANIDYQQQENIEYLTNQQLKIKKIIEKLVTIMHLMSNLVEISNEQIQLTILHLDYNQIENLIYLSRILLLQKIIQAKEMVTIIQSQSSNTQCNFINIDEVNIQLTHLDTRQIENYTYIIEICQKLSTVLLNCGLQGNQ
ncbi:hypothetical protein SS50377_21230 [Spironucleus salmonicida]|uniref:Uncharacterized protein n=1 Tax=Spironucleus salmonicida TaxID=348837 RepID=V6LI58_9EUKA|nr:hypothetical protein SS50377_21230 [Spironucleus salmonicida]|eukprot:EST44003.1 Hypothetical protein SS50377_16312 [Spironucleus salmonicida]